MKKLLQKLFRTHTNSFKLTDMNNLTSQDLHKMLQDGSLPSFLTTNQRERLKSLYESGKTFDAVRKLQGLIDSQNSKPKTFL